MFYKTPDCHLPAHATRAQFTGELRVALDIRHLTPTQVGTRTYAVCLANALAKLPEAERKEWEALWAEVERLRKMAGRP